MIERRRRFLAGLLSRSGFTAQEAVPQTERDLSRKKRIRTLLDNVGALLILFSTGSDGKPTAKVVCPFRFKWTVDTLPQAGKLFLE